MTPLAIVVTVVLSITGVIVFLVVFDWLDRISGRRSG